MKYTSIQNKTCCFTGHRNIKIPEGELRERLCEKILKAYGDNYNYFICGGAVGFDMHAAEILIELKNKFKNKIKLEIAVPCPGQDKLYLPKQKARYRYILENADKVTLICESYNSYCMQKRNEYMVNNSSLIIAYFEGESGGTMNTLEYAKKMNVTVFLV